MMIAKKGNKIHLFLLHHRFLACVERALGRTGDAGLEGGGAAHEGGGAGLGRGHLGGDDGLGHGVHSEHGHDLLFCFETVFGGAGGRRGAGSACACDLAGERGWTGRSDRHGACSRAMSTLDGRRDGSSIPRRARDRSPSRAPRSDIFRAAIDRSLASSERCLQARGGSTEGGRVAKPRVRAASRVTNVGRGRIDSPCGLFNEVCGARGSAGRREACFVLEYHQYSPSE